MSLTAPSPSVRAPRAPAAGRVRRLSRPAPELAGLLALAALLSLWSLSQNGWANEYYAAAVRSMASSWHAFLYGSFDPSGVMTVDKPPLALWVQALSVRVFGFHPLALLVPQALMGVASVGLLYDLVRRVWGRAAGFTAGLALALTPMSVAVSRHNNPDALLVLCSVAALWFLVRALQDGRIRWVALAGLMVGLGFETKMGAALLVLPGLAAAWTWAAPAGARRLRGLAAGGSALLASALAWPVLVWLTPAAGRPWISGTSDNSVWDLILGYNGLGRLDGQAGGPGGGMGGGPGGGTLFGGATGPFRLFGEALGGQAGWLVGFALLGGLGIAAATRLRRSDLRTGWLVATGGAFLGCAVAFSYAKGIFHPYYVSLLAPFTAALVGGTVGLLRSRSFAPHIVLPAAVIGGVAGELAVLRNVSGFDRLDTVITVVGVGCALALALVESRRLRAGVLALALGVLLIAPASWSVQTLGHPTNGTFPAGGPAATGFAGGPPGAGGGGMFGGGSASVSTASAYAKAHGGGAVVVASQSGAAGSIVASGADVAGIGGFSGRESTISTSWLAQQVASGRVRWVLVGSDGAGGMPTDGRQGSTAALDAVARTCKRVAGSTGSGTLYDCAGAAAKLAAAAS